MQARRHAWALAAVLLLPACGHSDRYVWVEQVPKTDLVEGSAADYVIAAGDVLTIRVYNQDAVTTRGRVRPDGRISVPLAGEVEAVGRRPKDLARELEAKLKPFFVAPAVAVGVDEMQPLRISVMGEVAHPGVYALDPRPGVLDALAAAGGMTEYADRDHIYVIRRRPAQAPLRIRFTWTRLTGSSAPAAGFALAPGDLVTVE
jgi:polysaccharide export outer membrane protein